MVLREPVKKPDENRDAFMNECDVEETPKPATPTAGARLLYPLENPLNRIAKAPNNPPGVPNRGHNHLQNHLDVVGLPLGLLMSLEPRAVIEEAPGHSWLS